MKKRKPAKVEETAASYVGKLPAETDKLHQAYTVIVQQEKDGFVAHCPECNVASQGATAKEARANLAEAMELFMETASMTESARRGMKLDLDAEELALHADISAAAARDLGR